MTKKELMDIIDNESNIYQEWQKHNNEIECLEEEIDGAFSRIKEAVEEFISQYEEK